MPSHGQATSPLVLRASDSIKSKKTGIVAKGTVVIVLQTIIQKSGSVRVEVALSEQPNQPIGWVTAYKGGVEMMRLHSAAEIKDGFFSSSSKNYNSNRTPSPRLRLTETDGPAGMGDLRDRYERVRVRVRVRVRG